MNGVGWIRFLHNFCVLVIHCSHSFSILCFRSEVGFGTDAECIKGSILQGCVFLAARPSSMYDCMTYVVKFVAIAVKKICLLSLTRCATSSFFSCTSHLSRQRYGSRPFWPISIQKIHNAGGTRTRAFLLVIGRQAETHDMGRKKMVRV